MRSYAILNQSNLFLSLDELKALVGDDVEYYQGVGIFNKPPYNVARRSSLIKATGELLVISPNVKDVIEIVKGKCFSINSELISREYKNEFLTVYNEIARNVKLSKKCEKLDLIFTEGLIIAGIRREERDTESLLKHSKKPYSQSGTLSPDIGRLMINLSKSKKEVVDPFVGTGTILIEAKWLNLRCIGSDIDDEMLKKSRVNLSYFNYECELIKADATTLPYSRAESVVTDPPYGRSFNVKEGLERLYEGFFYSASEITNNLVFTTDSSFDWRDKIKEAGFKEISIHFIYEHKSLSRAIYVVRK